MVRYIVQRGDTLGTIAVKYGTSVQAIAQVNGIRNPNMIYKGQMLRIPTPYYDDHHETHHKHYHHDDDHHETHHKPYPHVHHHENDD